MTLSSLTVKTSYAGDDATTDFATGFGFWNSSDLSVILVSSSGYETTYVEGTNYSVTGGGAGATGTVAVSTSTPPATGFDLLIKSNVALLQGTNLPVGGAFNSADVEAELDRTVRRLQQFSEAFDRIPTLAVASTYTGIVVPNPSSGYLMQWSTDNNLENVVANSSQYLSLPLSIANGGTSAVTAATARTALGAGTGDGDVVGPASATANSLAKFDGTTGKLLKDGAVIGVDVQAYDVDTLKADVADVLTAGFAATPYSAGAFSSSNSPYTPNEVNGNFQYVTNNGAHTIAPSSNNTTMHILYTNSSIAGTVTTSGFTIVTGDTLSTTSSDKFFMYLSKNNSNSHLHVTALQ